MITGVHLITGLIGSGKTLRAVGYIKAEIASGRAVYVCNVNGLNVPGAIPFDDPRQWQDLPPGSLLVVDEAQRFWRSRRTAEVPAELQAMETSRHDAVSFLLMTQQPTYLDKHLRGLVGRHEHLYRRMNLPSSQVFAWDRCVDDPQSSSEREGADESVFLFPKRDFGSYTSAEQHTVKARLGLRGKLILVAFAVVACIAWWITSSITSDTGAEASAAPAAAGSASAQPPPPGERRGTPLTPEEYIAKMAPRIPTAPWSAELFDGRKAQADPRLFCMESGAGVDALGEHQPPSVTCITEQGTPYALDEKAARMLARRGEVYNPFRPASKDRQTGAAARPQGGGPAPTANASPGVVIEGGQVNGVDDGSTGA